MLRSTALRVARPALARSYAAPAQVAPVALNNIEASWKTLTPAEQEQTFKHLEDLQKKDWKELSLDEKKAAYYVAFGPHGPREPLQANGGKTLAGTLAAVGVATLLFYFVRKGGKETPKSLSREHQEAANEMLREQRSDPYSGLGAGDAYKGKGQVTL
ncbi:hypothetical protein JCM9279_005292 [Rhodotorula babjevae]